MIKNVVFDFDGTLADTSMLIVATMQKSIEDYGLPYRSPDEIKSTIGVRLEEIPLILWPELKELGGPFAAIYRRNFAELKNCISVDLFPGVKDSLELLTGKGYRLAIATSRSQKSAEELTRQLGIRDCFEYLLGGDNVENGKPNPESIEKILSEMDWNPAETMMVGDMAVDIQMGKKAGITTCGVLYGNGSEVELRDAGAHFIVKSLSGLTEIIMSTGERVIEEMLALRDEAQSRHLARFFKTGEGEYGAGDKFLGIKVPVTRSIVKKFKDDVVLTDIGLLIGSEWHEIRLAGFLLLVELYRKAIKSGDNDAATSLVEFYISNLEKGNNWDLVDLVSGYILGDWVLRNPGEETVLFDLANKEGMLWHQRVAMVSTHALIRGGRFDVTFRIAEQYLSHSHDLIHKATGWMLREIGKRGGKEELVEFLSTHKWRMPRTMLRYAIERFPEAERQEYLRR